MSAVDKNKNFIYLYWKEPKENFKDGDSYTTDRYTLDIGGIWFWNADYKLLWKEAVEYTMLRLRLIEETEEEIDWLINCTKLCTGTPQQVKVRNHLIESAQLKLKALHEGMTD